MDYTFIKQTNRNIQLAQYLNIFNVFERKVLYFWQSSHMFIYVVFVQQQSIIKSRRAKIKSEAQHLYIAVP